MKSSIDQRHLILNIPNQLVILSRIKWISLSFFRPISDDFLEFVMIILRQMLSLF